MSDLLMPKLSDTMEEGTVLTWLVPDGTVVTRGQQIVEIETDKADMTVDAPENGALHILAAEGAVLPIGTPIAWIGDGAPPVASAATERQATATDEQTGRPRKPAWKSRTLPHRHPRPRRHHRHRHPRLTPMAAA